MKDRRGNDATLDMDAALDQVVRRAEGERITLGEIVETFGTRSYGSLLILVALIEMLPLIGAVPGMFILTGTLIIVIAAQLLVLRSHPWLPRRLLAVSISRDRLIGAVERARPWARRIGKVVRPRWTFLFRPPLLNLIALICIAHALLFFPLAIVPGSEKVLAIPVFFFGLALALRDGVLLLLGLTAVAASVWLVVYAWSEVWENVPQLLSLLGQ